ncbi:MAG: RNA methyltransferase [Deltaproteobacteria bacterium]|nr:RNA methyltransferase [Deltaproteobacteria bacterium]
MQAIYGVHPVAEALRNGGKIEKIILLKGGKQDDSREILEIATRREIPVDYRDREYLNVTAGTSHHQGVICIYEKYRSLIRTALCFGVDGLVIPENRAASVTPAVIKASAGAALHLPIARVVNISRIIDNLKKEGFWVYGTDAGCGEDLHQFDYSSHAGLVMGSEGKGIRPLVRKKCDFLVSIPTTAAIDSLNVSVSGGIILYEMTRNWNFLKVQKKGR